jgi:cytosine deaminase
VALAEQKGICRYLMVSSKGADDPTQADGGFRAYLQAKADADATLAASDLDWTILRPGALSDDAGTGEVTLALEPGGAGPTSRDDLAAVLLQLFEREALMGATVELAGGGRPVAEAIAEVDG